MTHLEFVNFTPRKEFREYADLQLDRILSTAPSDAVIKAKTFFTIDSFLLEVTIHSSEGRFRASASVPTPKRLPKDRMWQKVAFDAVTTEVSKQLTRWKKNRRFFGAEADQTKTKTQRQAA